MSDVLDTLLSSLGMEPTRINGKSFENPPVVWNAAQVLDWPLHTGRVDQNSSAKSQKTDLT